jgi:RHS repeat-associated protein
LTGREIDGSTGLYFYRTRYYSPTFGRFISEDALGFPGGPDPNIYAYAFDNPVSLIDPFGLDPGNDCGFFDFHCHVDVFKRLLVGGIGVAIGVVLIGAGVACFGAYGVATVEAPLLILEAPHVAFACGSLIAFGGASYVAGLGGITGVVRPSPVIYEGDVGVKAWRSPLQRAECL